MAIGCSGSVQVSFTSIPGTYAVHLDGQTLQRIINGPGVTATANFTINGDPGETISGYVEPLGVASCRVTFEYTLPECDIEVTSVCTPARPCDCSICKDEETVIMARTTEVIGGVSQEAITATLAGHIIRLESTIGDGFALGEGTASIGLPSGGDVLVTISPLAANGCNYTGVYDFSPIPCACVGCLDSLEVLGAYNPTAPLGFHDFAFSIATPPGLTLEILHEGDVTTGTGVVDVRVVAGEPSYLFTVSVANKACIYEGTFSVDVDDSTTADIELVCACSDPEPLTLDLDCPCVEPTPAGRDLVVSGSCGTISIIKNSGPGTVTGSRIVGVDDTTNFTVSGSNGCGDAPMDVADVPGDYPCGGDTNTCSFFTDFGFTLSTDTAEDFNITSFIVDGQQFITTPVPVGPPRLVVIGGYVYNTAFVDAINATLNPYVFASYPTGAQILASHALGTSADLRNSIIRLTYPTCSTFSIGITGGLSGYILTQAGFTGISFGVYGQSAPFGCTPGEIC